MIGDDGAKYWKKIIVEEDGSMTEVFFPEINKNIVAMSCYGVPYLHEDEKTLRERHEICLFHRNKTWRTVYMFFRCDFS